MIISYRSSRKLMQHPHQKSTIINVWVYFQICCYSLIYRPVHRYSIFINYCNSKLQNFKNLKFGSFCSDYFSCFWFLDTLLCMVSVHLLQGYLPNTTPSKNVERCRDCIFQCYLLSVLHSLPFPLLVLLIFSCRLELLSRVLSL